jgi:predicted Zn-dependent protease
VRYAVRLSLWLALAIALPVALGLAAGRLGAVAGAGASVLGLLYAWLWLPRAAHAAFEAGRFARAARRYRTLELIAPGARRARAALLSRAGCEVARGELAAAERLLARLDAATLDAAERAVWLNNRACAALAAERDPHAALALVDEASALRPDVPAVQHTRGMALLAVGRVDDAIAVLDGMRAGGELPARLEAERCRDLARAWELKGHAAYAEDYRLRAEGLAR